MPTPCVPWATVADLCPPYSDLDGIAGDLGWIFDIASEIMYDLTGQAYPGECAHVTRPPAICSCRYSDTCRCGTPSQIRLPDFPVRAVSAVKIDGVAVAAERWRIDNSALLVYMPAAGETRQGWPTRQRLDLPATEDGTWEVTYTAGEDPPPGGVHACAVLAGELILSCHPDLRDRCQLPRNSVSASSKGRTVAMIDPAQLAERGEVGIPLVDMWIRADRWTRSHSGGGVDTGAPVFRSVVT